MDRSHKTKSHNFDMTKSPLIFFDLEKHLGQKVTISELKIFWVYKMLYQ